jgi:hypothetical protein
MTEIREKNFNCTNSCQRLITNYKKLQLNISESSLGEVIIMDEFIIIKFCKFE